MLKEKKKSLEIAVELSRSQRTIQREIHRGQVQKLNGGTWQYYMTYDADVAQNDYMTKRGGSGPGLKIGHDHKLCEEIERQIKGKRSPDVIAQDIRKRQQEFTVTLCTRTLYTYLTKNFFLNVDYKDLAYGHYRPKRGTPVKRPPIRTFVAAASRNVLPRSMPVQNRAIGKWILWSEGKVAAALVF